MSKNYQPEVLEALKDVDFDANTYQVELNTNHGRILLDLIGLSVQMANLEAVPAAAPLSAKAALSTQQVQVESKDG